MDPFTIKVPFSFSLTLIVNQIHDTINIKEHLSEKNTCDL